MIPSNTKFVKSYFVKKQLIVMAAKSLNKQQKITKHPPYAVWCMQNSRIIYTFKQKKQISIIFLTFCEVKISCLKESY